MRLFIAVNFNAETREKLISLREELRSKSRGGNFTLDENLHLTLVFIGEASTKQVETIKTVMDSVTYNPFPVTIDQLGTFSRGTLWWAGLRKNEPLLKIQRELENKLKLNGFKTEERRYHPHITLGRQVTYSGNTWKFDAFGETVSKIDLMKSESIDGKLTYTSIYRRGKQLDPIIVEQYNPQWEAEFEALKEKLNSTIQELAVDIHHVGSTSVKGLAAKPILDIDIEIPGMYMFKQVKEKLAKLGYRHEGDYGIEGREAFKYGNSVFMRHHLYVCPSGSRELRRHIAFRDYLRKHPDMVREYSKLKQSLAAGVGNDIDAYTDGKTIFIERCLEAANVV